MTSISESEILHECLRVSADFIGRQSGEISANESRTGIVDDDSARIFYTENSLIGHIKPRVFEPTYILSRTQGYKLRLGGENLITNCVENDQTFGLALMPLEGHLKTTKDELLTLQEAKVKFQGDIENLKEEENFFYDEKTHTGYLAVQTWKGPAYLSCRLFPEYNIASVMVEHVDVRLFSSGIRVEGKKEEALQKKQNREAKKAIEKMKFISSQRAFTSLLVDESSAVFGVYFTPTCCEHHSLNAEGFRRAAVVPQLATFAETNKGGFDLKSCPNGHFVGNVIYLWENRIRDLRSYVPNAGLSMLEILLMASTGYLKQGWETNGKIRGLLLNGYAPESDISEVKDLKKKKISDVANMSSKGDSEEALLVFANFVQNATHVSVCDHLESLAEYIDWDRIHENGSAYNMYKQCRSLCADKGGAQGAVNYIVKYSIMPRVHVKKEDPAVWKAAANVVGFMSPFMEQSFLLHSQYWSQWVETFDEDFPRWVVSHNPEGQISNSGRRFPYAVMQESHGKIAKTDVEAAIEGAKPYLEIGTGEMFLLGISALIGIEKTAGDEVIPTEVRAQVVQGLRKISNALDFTAKQRETKEMLAFSPVDTKITNIRDDVIATVKEMGGLSFLPETIEEILKIETSRTKKKARSK